MEWEKGGGGKGRTGRGGKGRKGRVGEGRREKGAKGRNREEKIKKVEKEKSNYKGNTNITDEDSKKEK